MQTKMRYEAGRGGHAPGHLREMFCEAVEFGSIGLEQNDVPPHGHDDPVRWIVGQLWNCTDIMPHDVCETLDLGAGATYATGARMFARDRDLYLRREEERIARRCHADLNSGRAS